MSRYVAQFFGGFFIINLLKNVIWVINYIDFIKKKTFCAFYPNIY